MKKAVLLAAAMMIVATGAFASVARDNALQSQTWMVMDDTNIGPFPAESLKYNKLAIGELGGNGGTANDYMVIWSPVLSGLVLKVGAIPQPASVLALSGVYGQVGEPTLAIPNVGLTNGGEFSAGAPDGRIGVLYGWDMGGNGVALGLDYFNTVVGGGTNSTSTVGTVDTTQVDKSSAIVVNGGISMGVAALDPLSIGVSIALPSYEGSIENDPGTLTGIAGSGMGLDIAARGRLVDVAGKGVTTFVLGYVSMTNLKSTHTTADDDDQEMASSETRIGVGLANNVKVGDNSLIVCGVEAIMGSGSDTYTDLVTDDATEETSNSFELPVTVAFETQAWKWLTVRASSRSSVINSDGGAVSSDVNDNEGAMTSDVSNQNFAIGATVTLSDNFSIDTEVNEDFVFDGPYFIGGYANAGCLNANVSLVGRW
jgi:hypothetical protein